MLPQEESRRRTRRSRLLFAFTMTLSQVGIANAGEGFFMPGGSDGRSVPAGTCVLARFCSGDVLPAARPVSLNGPILAQADAPPATDAPASTEPDTVWGAVWDYLYNGASITVGIGTRQSELAVTRKSDAAYGKIAQRNDAAYFLSYSTRDSFIGTSHVGYTVMLNYSTFYMDKQEVDNKLVDLGTRVRGRVAYLVPTLFYQWGEHHLDGRFVRVGVGLGAGVAKYDGDIILNAPSNTTPTSISNGAYNLKLASSVFLEARYRYWGIKVSFAGPTYEDDTYKYSVSDIAVNLGYSFYF